MYLKQAFYFQPFAPTIIRIVVNEFISSNKEVTRWNFICAHKDLNLEPIRYAYYYNFRYLFLVCSLDYPFSIVYN